MAGWFPGLAGVICLLWDQDGMAPRTSEAGHARFDAKFGGALADELNGLLAGAHDASLGTPGPGGPTLAWRLDRLRDRRHIAVNLGTLHIDPGDTYRSCGTAAARFGAAGR
ncbi:hypothetical protein Dvina_31965 [Dactylosporangium vinaceum]|uniref:Uncharacterized protein n=1 Tax=Dactylosporangium vinaceum TaxID=53362 RepID=A0ABV5MAR1_9ACTN|nr:hypothetical protein [Dactylosporangium vinaceum]UAB92913.1 hypothetical protein Dvina_31965 [Dactylosporangium vinaceum]